MNISNHFVNSIIAYARINPKTQMTHILIEKIFAKIPEGNMNILFF